MNEPCYYRVSVKALICDSRGKFLLARESDGTWDFLGGGLDHNEDPIVALKREISEETGLVVTSVSESPQYFLTGHRADRDVYTANVMYSVTLRDLHFTPSDECEELRYFSVEEARKEKLLPNAESFLDLYDPKLQKHRLTSPALTQAF